MIPAIIILTGAIFILISAIGILRYDDLYSRMQASTKATSFGVLLIVFGAAIFFNEAFVYLKAVFIILFIFLTAPLGAHSISKSDKKGRLDD